MSSAMDERDYENLRLRQIDDRAKTNRLRDEIVNDVSELEMSARDLMQVMFKHISAVTVRTMHREIRAQWVAEKKRRGQR